MTNFIFDIDGTLTPSRQKMSSDFCSFFRDWMENRNVYLITGSDRDKTIQQIGYGVWRKAKRVYQCSGNVVYEGLKIVRLNTFKLSDSPGLKKDLLSMIKRSQWENKYGNHIEERGGLINFSTIGRDCPQKEREKYFAWDNELNERKAMCTYIMRNFNDLEASIGGQISIDIHKKGMNKAQIMDDMEGQSVFFGDRCEPGGNDHPLVKRIELENERVPELNHQWYHVRCPEHTRNILEQL